MSVFSTSSSNFGPSHLRSSSVRRTSSGAAIYNAEIKRQYGLPLLDEQPKWRDVNTMPKRKLAKLGSLCLALGLLLWLIKSRPTFNSGEEACNPFVMPGLLHINVTNADENYWAPHDQSCPPLTMMQAIRTASSAEAAITEELRFLSNKTVVLIGDSIDRHHSSNFCELSGGELIWINSKHNLSPPVFFNGRDEFYKQAGDTPEDEWLSRPWVCRVERYNFVMLSLFSYGLMDAEDYPRKWWEDSKHYYAPFSASDRFEHIIRPILEKMDRATIDLIELGSGFWDIAWLTARWKLEDFKYWEQSMTAEDLTQFASRLSARLRSLGRLSSMTKTILYRMPHLTGESFDSYIPASIITQIASVAEATVQGLSGRIKGKPSFATDEWFWESDVQDAKGLGMERSLRLDNTGTMMTGMHHLLSDNLHPNLLPNGKVWSDMLLYELKRIS